MIRLSNNKRLLGIFVLVVAFGCAGAAGYLYWQSRPHKAKVSTPQSADFSTRADAARQLQDFQSTPLPANATPAQQYQYHLTTAQLLAGEGKYAEAEAELQRIKDTGLPLSADYYELLGSTYRHEGKKSEAIAAYQQELTILNQDKQQNGSRIDSITSMIEELQS